MDNTKNLYTSGEYSFNKSLIVIKLPNDLLIFSPRTFKNIENILGFSIIVSDDTGSDLSDELLDIITDVRQDLRAKKDWDLADKIRDNLADLDIALEDK